MKADISSISIEALAGKLAQMQADRRASVAEKPSSIQTAFGEIACQAVHEWFASTPPQSLMINVAQRAVCSTSMAGRSVFWIGRVCWPYAPALCQADGDLLKRSVFVDVPHQQQDLRVWAIDLILRSRVAAVVVADGRDLDTAQSRRLQLASEVGAAAAMLWRKPQEMKSISVAHYRWRVTAEPTARPHPCWCVTCVRSKDASAWCREWKQEPCLVEHRYAEGLVTVSADVVSRSREAEVDETKQQRA